MDFFINIRNKRSNNCKHESIKMMIINLYQSEQYKNANFTHFTELLAKNNGIKVSYYFIHNLLSQVGIISPKCQIKLVIN